MSIDKENKITFEVKVIKIDSTYYMRIPSELKEYLDLRKGSKVKLQNEYGEHGPYSSFWSPNQQEKIKEKNESQE